MQRMRRSCQIRAKTPPSVPATGKVRRGASHGMSGHPAQVRPGRGAAAVSGQLKARLPTSVHKVFVHLWEVWANTTCRDLVQYHPTVLPKYMYVSVNFTVRLGSQLAK